MIHFAFFRFSEIRFRYRASSEGTSGGVLPDTRKPSRAPLFISIVVIVIIAFAAGLNYLQTSSVISNQNSTISSLNKQVTSFSNQVSSLNNQVSNDQNQINSLQLTISSLNQKISFDNATISSDQAKINSLNGTVASDQSEINTLNGQITSLNSQINSYSAQISALQLQTKTDQAEISDLQSIANLTNTTTLYSNFNIQLQKDYYENFTFSVNYAGYITTRVTNSNSSNTVVVMEWMSHGSTYVNGTLFATSGTVVYPVLPNSNTEVFVFDYYGNAMQATVTITDTS